MLGKNSLPHLSWFLEAACIPWLVAFSFSKTTTADPALLVLLHSDSASFILSLPLTLPDFLGCFRRLQQEGVREVPPCPSLVYKVPAPPLPGGQRWSWVALHARHRAQLCSFWRTQQNWLWPLHWFTFFVCCTVDLAFLGLPERDLFRLSEYVHSEGSDVFYQIVLQK